MTQSHELISQIEKSPKILHTIEPNIKIAERYSSSFIHINFEGISLQN